MQNNLRESLIKRGRFMIANIALEYPTYQVKAVRCLAPTELSELRQILANYTNIFNVFELVDFGDIDTLTSSSAGIVRVPMPDYPIYRYEPYGKIRQDYPYEIYVNRDVFVENNRTGAVVLCLYVVGVNEWVFFEKG